jgi:hypothetical protein
MNEVEFGVRLNNRQEDSSLDIVLKKCILPQSLPKVPTLVRMKKRSIAICQRENTLILFVEAVEY